MLIFLKCLAALVLVVSLGGVWWILTHQRRIKAELKNNEALPQTTAARGNLMVFISVFILAFCGLLLAFIIGY